MHLIYLSKYILAKEFIISLFDNSKKQAKCKSLYQVISDGLNKF